jgi:hypothetical protein
VSGFPDTSLDHSPRLFARHRSSFVRLCYSKVPFVSWDHYIYSRCAGAPTIRGRSSGGPPSAAAPSIRKPVSASLTLPAIPAHPHPAGMAGPGISAARHEVPRIINADLATLLTEPGAATWHGLCRTVGELTPGSRGMLTHKQSAAERLVPAPHREYEVRVALQERCRGREAHAVEVGGG